MALELDDINKASKPFKKTKLPFKVSSESLVERGELSRPNNEDGLVTLDKKLEKVENRTRFLIDKSNRQANTVTTAQQQANNFVTTAQQQASNFVTTEAKQIEPSASYFNYRCMNDKRLAKQVLTFIKERAMYLDHEWICAVHTSDLKQVTGKSSSHLANAICRLVDSGWFTIKMSDRTGTRVVKINPEHFGLQLKQ